MLFSKETINPWHFSDISLHLLSEQDLEETLNWRNTYCEWFNDSNVIAFPNHLQWFLQYQALSNDFVFIIKNKEENKVGQAAVYHIDWEKKEGEFGRFLVNPQFAGQSFMKKACLALLDFCKNYLKIHKVFLQVKPHNERALHVYKKTGFLEEQYLDNGNILMVCWLNP